MKLNRFFQTYGHRDIMLVAKYAEPTEYINLKVGDPIQPGDEAYTWATPKCLELDWVPVPKVWFDVPYRTSMVQIRRKS